MAGPMIGISCILSAVLMILLIVGAATGSVSGQAVGDVMGRSFQLHGPLQNSNIEQFLKKRRKIGAH